MSEAPREFIPVTGAEALSLLNDGAKNLAAVMIWTRDQGFVLNTHLSLINETDRTLYVVAPKTFDPKPLLAELARLESRDCFFSISLVRANVFFRAPFLDFKTSTLQFRFPTQVFKVQRRTDVRFVVPDDYSVKVEYDDPLFPEHRIARRAHDISAGGLSFVAPIEDAMAYVPGILLRNLKVTTKSLTLALEGEVRHTTVLPPTAKNPGTKVGVQFRNIRPGDAQKIANYVFEENRRYYTKFL